MPWSSPPVHGYQLERITSLIPSGSSVSLNPGGLCSPQAQQLPVLWQGPWMGRCLSLHLFGWAGFLATILMGLSWQSCPSVGWSILCQQSAGPWPPSLELKIYFSSGKSFDRWKLDLTRGFSDFGFLSLTELSHRRVQGVRVGAFGSS